MSCIRFLRHAAPLLILASDAAAAVPPTVNAHKLGIAESMSKYCTRVDAADAGKWRQQTQQISQGASKAAIARVRTTQEYQSAYQSVTDFVARVAPQNVKRACTVPAASTN